VVTGKKYGAKATFFVVGRNIGKGAINDPSTTWPATIRRMFSDGHQIASHTWSHQKLTELSETQFRRQMIFNEIAIADLLGGKFPTYMRPPHSMSDSKTDAWLGELGYHITYFDLNTRGYENDSPGKIGDSMKIWDERMRLEKAGNGRGHVLQIEHDPIFHAVYNLTEHMLQSLAGSGFRAVTVGECLGDPKNNWYRTV
jgi:peptidoglycan/xylan/chitin deacetylase (PgdA/CDA1 family)